VGAKRFGGSERLVVSAMGDFCGGLEGLRSFFIAFATTGLQNLKPHARL